MEDLHEDSKHNNPEETEAQVPSEQVVHLELFGYRPERCGEGQNQGRDAGEHSDDHPEPPDSGCVVCILLPLADAHAVDSHNDDAKEELQAADDKPRNILPYAEWRGRGLCTQFIAHVCCVFGVGLVVGTVLVVRAFDLTAVLQGELEEFGDGRHDSGVRVRDGRLGWLIILGSTR